VVGKLSAKKRNNDLGGGPRATRDQVYESAIRFLNQRHRESRAKTALWIIAAVLALGYLGIWLQAVARLSEKASGGSYAAVVRIQGQIAADLPTNAGTVSEALERAFADEGALGVALVINSPGGQPAQSQLIHDTIRRLSRRHDKPVIAVGEDYLTSGAYLIAMAADRVYAPTTALVGSIGVVQHGVDLSALAERYGVRDRTYTAGDMKAPFNPLSPPTDAERAKAAEYLGDIHREFIRIVTESRGARIDPERAELFSGAAWTGMRAAGLGLIDGHLDLRAAVREAFGAEEVREYAYRLRPSDLLRLLAPR
jgi:protease-4